MAVSVLTNSWFEQLDALLHEVYLGEGYSDLASAARLSAVVRSEAGIWLGSVDEHGSLNGVVLVVGFGSSASVVAQPGGAELRLLAVAPTARGKGVGRALVTQAERIARDDGATMMTFSTQSTMTAAQCLYRSLGYERIESAGYLVGDRHFLVFHKQLLAE